MTVPMVLLMELPPAKGALGMPTKIFLFAVALIFIGYGIACALDPALPARLAGLSIESADGYAEMGAMYGGLQVGVGLFCLLGALQQSQRQSTLLLLVLAIGLLAILRAVSALRTEDPVGSYTLGALAFESLVAIISLLLVRRGTR